VNNFLSYSENLLAYFSVDTVYNYHNCETNQQSNEIKTHTHSTVASIFMSDSSGIYSTEKVGGSESCIFGGGNYQEGLRRLLQGFLALV